MQAMLILSLIKAAWESGLRDLVERAIENPDEQWDEYLLNFLDVLFGLVQPEIK